MDQECCHSSSVVVKLRLRRLVVVATALVELWCRQAQADTEAVLSAMLRNCWKQRRMVPAMPSDWLGGEEDRTSLQALEWRHTEDDRGTTT